MGGAGGRVKGLECGGRSGGRGVAHPAGGGQWRGVLGGRAGEGAAVERKCGGGVARRGLKGWAYGGGLCGSSHRV